MLQPATKALAQVLAGRSNASGQLAHAQAVLAHAERLIGERAHNRLNPSEREEFFEQLARLRLTLSDAASEAEVVAAEEQEPRPVAPPVDQARLRALALALSTPAAPSSEPAATARDPEPPEEAGPVDDEGSLRAREEEAAPAATRVSAANARSGRLQLSRASSDDDAPPVPPPAASMVRRARSRTKPALKPVDPTPADAPVTNGHQADSVSAGSDVPAAAPEEQAGQADPNDTKPAARRPRRRKTAGLPEGWVIDEEGFVVPGPQ